MPKILRAETLGNIKDADQFMPHASAVIKDTVDTVNGKLEYDKNLATQTVSVNFPDANTTVGVNHNLNKVGVHYQIAKANAGVHVFDGTKSNTDKIIYLQASGPAKVTLILS